MENLESELKPYIGVPYKWCLQYEEDSREGNRAPFWRLDKLPTPEEVVAEGCCCVGLLNFSRIARGLPTFAGTGHIGELFEGLIKPLQEELPIGAMLLRRLRDEVDQGHVAIVVEGQRLLHCYVDDPVPAEGLCNPGVAIDASWKESHAWREGGYYDGFVLVEDWLSSVR